MLPPIPSERSILVSVPQSERRTRPTHRDLALLLVVMIRISYIVATANDLVTLEKLVGIIMVDCLLEDEVVIQAL